MNEALKLALTSLIKSVVDRAVVALGVALLSHGLLVQGQVSDYEQIGSGIVMVLIGAAVGWYRDHGKALVQAEKDQLNAKVDELTAKVAQSKKK